MITKFHKSLGYVLLHIFITVITIDMVPSTLNAQQGMPRNDRELHVGFSGKPRHLNPAVQSGTYTGIPGAQLFAFLLRIDRSWKYHPYLAEKWDIAEDGLSATFYLRKGATFHDGKPITSKDVAFSIQTVRDFHPFSTMLAAVKRVETPDAYTATLRLKQPHPALMLVAASPMLPIIPEHVYGDGKDLKKHPANWQVVGSGPFRLADANDNEIVLEKYDNFFLPGKPYLEKVVFHILRGRSLQLAFETGLIHFYAFNLDMEMSRQFEERQDLTVSFNGYEGIGPLSWLAFNLHKPPFNDLRVRQALALAIDRDFLANSLYRGKAQVATGPISPGTPFYTESVEKYDLDVHRANDLLDAAGYPRDDKGIRFSTTLTYRESTAAYIETAEYFRTDLLRKLGVIVQLAPAKKFPEFAKRVSNWEFFLALDNVFNWGDPVIGVHRTYATQNIRKGVMWSNTQGYSNPAVDALMARAGTEINLDKRKAIYNEFQQIVANEVPVYWLVKIPYFSTYHRNLEGMENSIWGSMFPYDAVRWKR